MSTSKSDIKKLNTVKPSVKPGDALKARYEVAQQTLDEANPLGVIQFHAGRELYVNEANKEVYQKIMGDKPVVINDRLYSQHAIKKGMDFIHDSSDESLNQYREARDNHQDLIDEKLSELKIFSIPETAEELERRMEDLARRAKVSLKGLKAIEKAHQATQVIEAYQALGIELIPTENRETSEERQTKINNLVKQGGRGKIKAALMTKK
ncbi:hypothetical protein [Vibrio crassostreae]|uniref:hypothetical protein n=1 Tax=Vibrio crassostreae TaxID=246167 RepID=UPI00104A7ADC|nr:hypothetical protein [Vibrio crassostreae]TCV07217.1 hypothetical protein EDB16_11774 [Vibrio crassostreae]TWD59038.1 hypothetical protein FB444_11735 [Vibrio crassostreae]